MTTVGLDLSGPDIALTGLTEPLRRRLVEEWPNFVVSAKANPFLHLSVQHVERAAPPGEYLPKAMRVERLSSGLRFSMAEGVGRLHEDGEAEIELAHSEGLRPYYTLMNLLRGCLAWRIRDRGGALLHAAGLVVDGRAFLLVGAEGAGKSTWARLGEAAGATVVSDDLVLIDGAGSGLHVVGGPFRSTHHAVYHPGRWPLAALLFPRHAATAALTGITPIMARARVAANLPFLGAPAEDAMTDDTMTAEAMTEDARGQDDARLSTSLDRLIQARCLQLDFALNGDFVELLRALPDR